MLERLGAGGMGEVWKAQDNRFESRIVAIKLLKEDDTIRQDADNREKLEQFVRTTTVQGGLPVDSAEAELEAALRAEKSAAALRTLVENRAGAGGRLSSDVVLALFDELVNDTRFSENARMRARMRRLFHDEANAVANLRHDNIVGISDYGEQNGAPFLVMSYIEGDTLARVIQRRVPLTRARQLELMENLCAGLAYAHEHKLVHRDIKPANLIIDAATGSLKILDFGVVRRLREDSQSTVGVAIGTLCYMSPEQIRGAAVDHRSDIFSVGDVFYELLTHQVAFPVGDDDLAVVDLMTRIQRQPPVSVRQFVPDLEPEIEPILNRALAKDVNARYQSLTEMQHDLARLRGGLERADRTVLIQHGGAPVGSDEETRLAGAVAEPTPRERPATTETESQRERHVEPRKLRRASLVWGSLGALVLVTVGAAVAWKLRPPPRQTVQKPQVVAPSLVTVDIHPWARVTIAGVGGAQAPAAPATYTTPFMVQLDAGRYQLKCEDGGPTATFDITVETGQPLRVDKVMPGFDVDRVVNALLGPGK